MLILKLLVYVVIGLLSLCMAGIGAMMFAGIPMMDIAEDSEDDVAIKTVAAVQPDTAEPAPEAKKLEPTGD